MLSAIAHAWFPSRNLESVPPPALSREVLPIVTTRIHGLCWGMAEKEQRQRCWRCDGTLWPQTAIDLHYGVAVQLLVCRSCSRRWYPGDKPRLAISV